MQYRISFRNASYTNSREISFPITYFSVTQSFWNITQNTVVSLSYSVHNFEMIGKLKRMLQTHKISRDMKLTHRGRVTHICVGKLTIIGSDNGLSPGQRQAIIWTNACILLIALLGTNFSEILIDILTFSYKKMRLKVSSAKWRPCCRGFNVLTLKGPIPYIYGTQVWLSLCLQMS